MSLNNFNESWSVLSGAQRSVSPVIFYDTQNNKSSQRPKHGISEGRGCFSKQVIQKQLRKDYIAAAEEKLTKHPLMTYPYYKDHMTPELFHKVASILDPDMCVIDASGLSTPTEHHVAEEKDQICR
ncbi:putative protein FAM47D [Xyrichtys novacula]|uniref:Uncharacterized protein n=1 Tax=Xyrichtys novacula TaxID=13765 RepID=A0AAV1G9G0_XYRNO|nr:putative protein FAM47D [Xyrichtys novacula]